MKYLPIYLDLKDRDILVVGTGHEAEPKVLQFLQAGAKVKLISETRPVYINEFDAYSNFIFEQRNFSISDLKDIWLVISTLADRSLNEYIFETAMERKIFCNVVDVTDLCSFIFPAIVSQGDINIAISTSGTSPALAQKIKSEIANLIGPEYGALAGILGRERKEILKQIPNKKERTKLFQRLVNSEAIQLLKRNQNYEAEILIAQIIEKELKGIVV
ncbi:MAG: bifunctional precorrin-2 dehydrogenase/sirohydrochlorin ferrochelatase [Ignavibacteriaceae bacterium]|jgi:precorrin-2 dehydrogenase/sirohydrochlorin ferrochelatase